jgi:hypothetical protein
MVLASLAACTVCAAAVFGWNTAVPALALTHGALLALGFMGALVLGVPIGFVLAFSSLLYFLTDPSLPLLVYAQ